MKIKGIRRAGYFILAKTTPKTMPAATPINVLWPLPKVAPSRPQPVAKVAKVMNFSAELFPRREALGDESFAGASGEFCLSLRFDRTVAVVAMVLLPLFKPDCTMKQCHQANFRFEMS